jgi:hypothetical protein
MLNTAPAADSGPVEERQPVEVLADALAPRLTEQLAYRLPTPTTPAVPTADDTAGTVHPAQRREAEPGGKSATSLHRRPAVDTEDSHRVTNRPSRPSSRDETRTRREILEKHYKTREVAELLSVSRGDGAAFGAVRQPLLG